MQDDGNDQGSSSADQPTAPNDPTGPIDPIAPSVPTDPHATPFPGRVSEPVGDTLSTQQLPIGGVPPMPPPMPPPPSVRWEQEGPRAPEPGPAQPQPQGPEPRDPEPPAAVWGSSQGSQSWDPSQQATWQPRATPVATERPRRRVWPVLVAVVLASALIGGGLGYGLSRGGSNAAADKAITLVEGTQAAPASNAAQMVARVLPSVVNIRVTVLSTDPLGGQTSGQAEGSGVVLSKNGLIVTNAHVVSGATSVKVVFTDGHASLDGTVLGVDTVHDLAVVKVDANDLDPVTIGHSKTLKLVDDVYAIGFPLDLGPTVTRGVISGLNRTIDVSRPDGTSEHLEGMLQTDAAINPGNSGGALIDGAGQLVGINTAGAQASQAENVGFAIAIDGAIPIVRSLAEGNSPPSGGTGTVTDTAWLGVSVEPVDSDTVDARYGVPAGTRGAGVVEVVAGGPSVQAGIKVGDVIVSVGGESVTSLSELHAAVASHKPGERVDVSLVSPDGTRTVTVTLGTRPANLG